MFGSATSHSNSLTVSKWPSRAAIISAVDATTGGGSEAGVINIQNPLHRSLETIIVDHWTTPVTLTNSWFAVSDPALVDNFATMLFLESDSPELFQEESPVTGQPFTNDVIRLKRRWAWVPRVDEHRSAYAFISTT